MAAPVSKELTFPGAQGDALAAKLDLPEAEPLAYQPCSIKWLFHVLSGVPGR